jgi:hypothetical protein
MVNLKEGLQDRERHIIVQHFMHQTLQVPKRKAPEEQDTLFDNSVKVRSL